MKVLNETVFKGCVKGKIKFTVSTFVKYLITGIAALSFTACGGGGGGGGSSSSGNSYITTYPGIDNIIAKEIIKNQTGIFDKDIENNNADFTALKIINNSDITFIDGKNIKIEGKKGLTGVLVSNNSKFTNRGTITVEQEYLEQQDDIDVPIDIIIAEMGKGIFVTGNSTGINEGTINIKGSTAGILAYGKGSTGINKGKINITDNKGSTWDNLQANGMISVLGGKVINDQEAEIIGSVSGSMGMFSYKGELINKGKISLMGNDIYGMAVQYGIIENSGNITIIHKRLNTDTGEEHPNVGIDTMHGKSVNKGMLEMENGYVTHNFDNGYDYDFDDYYDVGMYGGEGSDLINEQGGTIQISGSTIGMMVDGEYGGDNTLYTY